MPVCQMFVNLIYVHYVVAEFTNLENLPENVARESMRRGQTHKVRKPRNVLAVTVVDTAEVNILAS